VVDLVRARVVEVLALQVNLGAAQMFGQALGKIEGVRTANILAVQLVQFGQIVGVLDSIAVCLSTWCTSGIRVSET